MPVGPLWGWLGLWLSFLHESLLLLSSLLALSLNWPQIGGPEVGDPMHHVQVIF